MDLSKHRSVKAYSDNHNGFCRPVGASHSLQIKTDSLYSPVAGLFRSAHSDRLIDHYSVTSGCVHSNVKGKVIYLSFYLFIYLNIVLGVFAHLAL